jgi:hypothetical protein
VRLAARGTRKTGDSVETITDAAELAQVRRQARKANIESLLVAIPLTLIALAVRK